MKKNKKDLNNECANSTSMRNVARAGLGFAGGFFTLFGAYVFQSKNFLVGGIAIIIGVALFVYAYKG